MISRSISFVRQFEKNLWVLSFGWFVSALGFAISIPFIAIYFHSELGISFSGLVVFLVVIGLVRSFFQELSEHYENVIVDSAPINRYPDAQVLAGIIGQAALVVRANHTSREAVAQARKNLEAGGGKVVGVILNKRTYPIPGFLYRRL